MKEVARWIVAVVVVIVLLWSADSAVHAGIAGQDQGLFIGVWAVCLLALAAILVRRD